MIRGAKLMSRHKIKVTGLLFLIIIASALLILTNYASLKITSAVRSYIAGESLYSKGQKDASRTLELYINTHEIQYWEEFQNELSVPIGDSLARTVLVKEGSREFIKKGFLQGRNKQEDLDEMIWLFNNFKNVTFMSEAIGLWKKADKIVGELATLGNDAHSKMMHGTLTVTEKEKFIDDINKKTADLSILERSFSDSLGTAARAINTYLFYVNMLMTILIIGSITAYILSMIRKLRSRNVDLILINQELDKFVYSASHDLRAPISSLKGLISLISNEKDPKEVKHYLHLMTFTLNKQDQFIREIIDYSKNKKTRVEKISVSLDSIINQTIAQHRHMPTACTIEIQKQIDLDTVYSDPVRLEIVLKNIISNAIKYSDPNKKEKFIKIKTSKNNNRAIITIEDNGIGIDDKYLDRIFEMFFVTDHNQNGSGLGLYLVKETINKLNGTIDVVSEKGKGSKFIMTIPAV